MVKLVARFAFAASLASLVSASPVAQSGSFISVPISKKAGKLTAKDLVQKEQARVKSFSGALAAAASSGPVVNEDVSYVVSTTIGTQTFANVIVDTGSSNTWVGVSGPPDLLIPRHLKGSYRLAPSMSRVLPAPALATHSA